MLIFRNLGVPVTFISCKHLLGQVKIARKLVLEEGVICWHNVQQKNPSRFVSALRNVTLIRGLLW